MLWAAYDRFLNDKTSLYDMSDVTIGDNPDVPAPEDKDITLTDVEGYRCHRHRQGKHP